MKKIALIVVILSFFACNDDNETNSTSPGAVNLEFENTIDNDPIVLNTGSYANQSNETYSISEMKYITSNIVLIKENGDEFAYPVEQSYFVINEEIAASKTVNLSDIPAGEYTKVRFGFGVSQTKYPIESGTANFIPTAEENGMLWGWAQGYKFLKFEGSFTPQGGNAGDFLLHIGSHGTALDNYKEITLDLTEAISVGNGNTSTINITADIAKIFDSTNTHSLEDKSDIQVDPRSEGIAENVQTMFSIQ